MGSYEPVSSSSEVATWTVAVGMSGRRSLSGEDGDEDRRHTVEVHHGQHPQTAVSAKEALAARARIRPTRVWLADRAIDDAEVSDGGVLLKDRRENQRRC